MKRCAAMSTGLATLLTVVLFAALVSAQPIRFGKDGDVNTARGTEYNDGFEPTEPSLKVKVAVTGVAVVTIPELLSQTGGALLVGVAEPHRELWGEEVELKYSAPNKDGRRVEVLVGTRPTVYMDLHDWELKPLVELVDSGYHGAINMAGGPKEQNILLHRAFQTRLLGLRFIQADLMPRGKIASQRYLPRWEGQLILGAGEERGWRIRATLAERRLSDLFRTHQARYHVLTDAGAEFTYSIVGHQLVVSGRPYIFAWNPKGNRVAEDVTINKRFKEEWRTLRRLNPIVVRAIERTFRSVAFFRRQIRNNFTNWNAFANAVRGINLHPVPTPRRLVWRGG